MIEKLRAKWEKSGLKSWTAGKIHLSRGKKLALDLVIIVLAGGWLWGLAGCPLPTVEMEFRRLERQYLLPRSEIVYQTGFWNIGDVEEIKSRDGTYLSVFQPFVAGTIKDQVYAATLYAPGKHIMNVVPLGKGPTPIPINSVIAWVPEPGKVWMSGCNLLFYQIPGETTRTELDVDTVLLGGERFARYAQEGICLEEGLWLFSMKSPEGAYSQDWYAGASYALRLYGEGGELLLEQEGVLPEPM